MTCLDFIQPLHRATTRDYHGRFAGEDKARCATKAKAFGFEYFDGDRRYGYGGYSYDGRWLPVAASIVKHYRLCPGDRVLDVGCAKGFLVHDLLKVLPGLQVSGIDISEYAIANAMPEVKPHLRVADAVALPYAAGSFDLVVSINTVHNLRLPQLETALREFERVGKRKYVVTDSYRNESEKVNLLDWQLTCECFFTPEEWLWVFHHCGYTGDYGFIFFE